MCVLAIILSFPTTNSIHSSPGLALTLTHSFISPSPCPRPQFAVKTVVRRVKDWLDWMLVEAWNMEHNQLHHYHLGELEDPDLVEHNMTLMREAP